MHCVQKKIAESDQQGVVLIEALIAILLFSLGVLAVAGLQASMIKNTSDSKFRADANYVAQQYVGQIWANPTVLPAIPDISKILPNGALVTNVVGIASGVQVTVTVTWQQPGEELHTYRTQASIAGN